jgi:dTDP-4-amino-4,6-dideoxygalactose transaminase
MTASRVRFMHLQPAEDAPAVDAAIRRVIDRGWYVLGPEVEAFERDFAAACGAGMSVGVGTGTDAIAIILRGLGIGAGDEVITTPVSAAYTALACMMVGARPVFADVDPTRLTIDPAAIEAAITPKTAAILPVHLYGQPADMPAIMAIAAKRSLTVIEDCCQSHLATCAGKPVGSFGVAAAYSFYPTKNLGALGDGGAITTSDPQLAAKCKRIRNGGQTDRYHHGEMGVNSRLDEMQAAILAARLPHLRGWTEARRARAAIYRRALGGAPVTVPPECDPGHVYHLFPVLSATRDRLQAFLREQGVETLIHYPVPIPRQPAVQTQRPAPCPIADRVCAHVLSLPIYPAMPEEEIHLVVDAVTRFGGAEALPDNLMQQL